MLFVVFVFVVVVCLFFKM